MDEDALSTISDIRRARGPAEAIDELIRTLEASQDFHRVFDALLLKKKFEMGLPLARPASFDGVPEERQPEFEEAYMAAARRVGDAFLSQGNIPQAWVYFRTIREPQGVVDALDRIPADGDLPENLDDLIGVALYERAHPVKGLELMLRSRGTCNTISSFDQAVQQISAEERQRGAELLVGHLHGELLASVCRDIERRTGQPFSADNLSEALAGRDWLFDEGNYHVDVSHLGAVVRFARFLDPGSARLQTAIQLADYGGRLSSQYQYPADPPFDEYYLAHRHFFQVLAGVDRDESLAYFRKRLDAASDPDDRRMIAYVLVDLLVRIGEFDQAVVVADDALRDLDESSGFSFAQLCEEAGRMDVLRRAAAEKGDLVGFTAAILRDGESQAV